MTNTNSKMKRLAKSDTHAYHAMSLARGHAGKGGEMALTAWTVGEVAKEVGVSPGTIRNWIDKGYIQAFRLPSGVRRIPEMEVRRLIGEYFADPSEVLVGTDEPAVLSSEPTDDGVWTPIPEDLADSSDLRR
jgi:excisionase family DNA binding protein